MSTKSQRAKSASTYWKLKERLYASSFVEVRLGTGRTHQIRVHFSSIGHPVLGDHTYGKKMHIKRDKNMIVFQRQMLHAETLGFIHPISGKKMEFTSKLPSDFELAVNQLRL